MPKCPQFIPYKAKRDSRKGLLTKTNSFQNWLTMVIRKTQPSFKIKLVYACQIILWATIPCTHRCMDQSWVVKDSTIRWRTSVCWFLQVISWVKWDPWIIDGFQCIFFPTHWCDHKDDFYRLKNPFFGLLYFLLEFWSKIPYYNWVNYTQSKQL